MLIYDITDLESFKKLISWLIDIKKYAPKNVYKILVGNKCDDKKRREVSFAQGKEFASIYGMKFFETSAKYSIKVFEAFNTMTADIILKPIQIKNNSFDNNFKKCINY